MAGAGVETALTMDDRSTAFSSRGNLSGIGGATAGFLLPLSASYQAAVTGAILFLFVLGNERGGTGGTSTAE